MITERRLLNYRYLGADFYEGEDNIVISRGKEYSINRKLNPLSQDDNCLMCVAKSMVYCEMADLSETKCCPAFIRNGAITVVD